MLQQFKLQAGSKAVVDTQKELWGDTSQAVVRTASDIKWLMALGKEMPTHAVELSLH